VRELVNDQPVEPVRRFIERQQHAIAVRFGKRQHTLLGRSRDDVLLFEFAVRLENNERNLDGEIVLQVRADLLVRAFGV
jgi:hypothetical protein